MNGAALLKITPNKDAVAMSITATTSVPGLTGQVNGVPLELRAAYSAEQRVSAGRADTRAAS